MDTLSIFNRSSDSTVFLPSHNLSENTYTNNRAVTGGRFGGSSSSY